MKWYEVTYSYGDEIYVTFELASNSKEAANVVRSEVKGRRILSTILLYAE